MLSHLGIEKFFDVLMTAEKYSKPKPNPEPLLLALKKLNLKPDQVVYIGDTQIDADAAKAAGITFIHYGKKNVNGYDHHIDYFNELLPILEQM